MSLQGALNNPSTDYGYHDLSQRVWPDDEQPEPWGCLIHPDEIRKFYLLGNSRLITTNGEQATDDQIKGLIDQKVRAFSNHLQWDIYPRLWRHRLVKNRRRTHVDDDAQKRIERFAEWEDVYYKGDVRDQQAFSLTLRHRPVAALHKWQLISPVNDTVLLDLLNYALVRHRTGHLDATITGYGDFSRPGHVSPSAYRAISSGKYQAAYYVDYSTGYERVEHVPLELKEQVIKEIVIEILSAYGDGIVGGLANSSISVGVLHESIGTTMSATSAFYGARIKQLREERNAWDKLRALHYRGVKFGTL